MTAPLDRIPHPRTRRSSQRAVCTARLLRKARNCDDVERDEVEARIIELNMPIARAIAARFTGRGEALEDLVQVAYTGLVKAVRGFDPDRTDDFLKYAVPTIAGALKRHFRDVAWTIRPPRSLQEAHAAVAHAAGRLTQELGRVPRPSELAERLQMPLELVAEALTTDDCFTPTSLDERGGADNGGYPLIETLGEEDLDLQRAEVVVLLRPLCRRLPPREQRILFLRFFRGWTQAEIAAEIGLSQMQVSRLLLRILTGLRDQLSGDELTRPGD